jgi:hypothetical protein
LQNEIDEVVFPSDGVKGERVDPLVLSACISEEFECTSNNLRKPEQCFAQRGVFLSL